MNARAIYQCLLVFVLLFPAMAVGAIPSKEHKPRRIYAPAIDGYASASRAIEDFDADNDGKLSGKELDKCPGLKAALKQVDADGDGAVTAGEITDRIHSWQKSRLGRMSMGCRVLRNGRPLEGAEVKFVPEKFLGENLKTATGKTDQNGMAMICIPGVSPPGIAPGFYRVEITKDGEKVPAKYNTKTIFGQEIALDAVGIQEGVTFELEYLPAKTTDETPKTPASSETPDQSATPAKPPKKSKSKRIMPLGIDPVAAGSDAVKQFDADKDGKISGKELDKCPGLKAAIEQVDADGDDAITADEIAERIRAWQRSKLGRMSFSCRVTLSGKPLEGAEVKLVPEKFLGNQVRTATGKTDKHGMAMINIPKLIPPGIAPGFYRVEITKDGEKIPAKYNTETICGQEIALDAAGIQEGVAFDLEY